MRALLRAVHTPAYLLCHLLLDPHLPLGQVELKELHRTSQWVHPVFLLLLGWNVIIPLPLPQGSL